jgi:hypothetical protein
MISPPITLGGTMIRPFKFHNIHLHFILQFIFLKSPTLALGQEVKPAFCPNIDIMYYALMTDLMPKNIPVSSQIEKEYFPHLCEQKNCISFCSTDLKILEGDWIAVRNQCRAGSLDKFQELMKIISQRFTIDSKSLCKYETGNDKKPCEPDLSFLCFVVGGEVCFNEVKKSRKSGTSGTAFKNAACKSGVAEACRELDAKIDFMENHQLSKCKSNFYSQTCLNLMIEAFKRGKK